MFYAQGTMLYYLVLAVIPQSNISFMLQVRKLEKQFAANKEAMENAVALVAGEADRIRGDISEMRSATSHNLAASDQQILALQVGCENVLNSTVVKCPIPRIFIPR